PGYPQAVVFPAEVVGAAHQVHPRLQPLLLVQQRPPAPHQPRQAGPEGRVEPLDVGRVDPRARTRPPQHRLDRLQAAPHHPAHGRGQAPAAVALDDLPDEQPRFDHQPGPAADPLDLVAEAAQPGADVAGQAIDAPQNRQALQATAHHHDQGGDEAEVAVAAEDAAQPQARGHRQGQRQPEFAADHLDPQLVGLDVLGIDAGLLDVEVVEALGVLAGLLLPGGDRAFVQAEGGDDGLKGTAVGEQGQDQGGQFQGLVEAVERGVAGGGEGLAAGGAAEAFFLLGVNADVAVSDHAPVQAVE